jgi:hypothetical protein
MAEEIRCKAAAVAKKEVQPIENSVGALLYLCTMSYLLAVSLRLYYHACYRTGVSLRLYYYVHYRAGSTTLLGISQHLLYPFILYPLSHLLHPRNLITICSPSLDGSNIARVLL